MTSVQTTRPVSSSQHPQDSRSVTVKAGDSLSSIAQHHGVSLDAVIKANPQIKNPSLIHPGQQVHLPEPAQAAPAKAAPQPEKPAPAPAPQGGSVTVKKGDTLSGIAEKHGVSLAALKKANPQITNPSLIHVGEQVHLPGAAKPSSKRPPEGGANRAKLEDQIPSGKPTANQYDGVHPAAGTTKSNAALPVNAPLTNKAGDRHPSTYNEVLDQFAVGHNPRYAQRNGNTYCNIFVSDATKAMGAEIPHWVDGKGNPSKAGAPGAWEMGANETNRWLNNHGNEHGWKKVSAAQAQEYANQGKPAVASWPNPGGIGHIAMVRPGEITDRGVAIAQAGAHNFNKGHLEDGFGSRQPQYWVHE